MINAGDLRYRVALQVPVETPDGFGSPTRVWTKIGDRWVSIKPLSGRELMLAQQAKAESTHKVTMRYESALSLGRVSYGNLDTRCRLVHGTTVYNVDAVLPRQYEGWLELLCSVES